MVIFELFLNTRSLGTVSWERGGWVVLRIRDPEERRFLISYFQGPHSKEESEEVRFRPEGLTPEAFEVACVGLVAERGYQIAARPTGG
jgi:hypothetical protein